MTILRSVHLSTIPPSSMIHAQLPGAYYADAYLSADPAPHASALAAWLDVVARTPAWTRQLLALRHRLVRLVGLKGTALLDDVHAGQRDGFQPDDLASYRVGDRVGLFEIRQLNEREVVMGQDDKHLDVQVSLCKHTVGGEAVAVLSTVVHIHNTLGRAYMLLVTPFHRVIVRSMLQRLAAAPHGPR